VRRALSLLVLWLAAAAVGAQSAPLAQQPVQPAVSGAQDSEHLVALVQQAQAFFSQAANNEQPEEARALYQRALDRFLAVLEEGGVRNGRLLYNIGNTYFLLGDLGQAMLYLRRSELLDPTDRNLQHNLEFVRSQRTDRLPPNQLSAAARTVLFWHYLLPLPLKLYLFAAAFAAACLLGAGILLRGPGRRRSLWLPAAAGGVALLLLGSLVADEARRQSLRDGVILAQEVVARKGDGTAYQSSFVDPLHAGTEFRLLEVRSGWYRILLSDGRTAWIPADSAQLVRLTG
jgi:tetratricopeptide (TPR) repeat protein